ncbi:MAG TPA: hypothetical protein VFV52_11640 [Bacilli bacterium]|nr:hypothetical protein [Bacilli bacterium]
MHAVITLGLALGTLLLLVLFSIQTRKFKRAVNQLPSRPRQQSSAQPNHPLIGRNIGELFPFPEHLQNRAGLVFFTSPICPTCHKKIEDYIIHHKHRGIPFATITKYSLEHPEMLESFLEKYQDEITILPTDELYLKHTLNQTRTPLLCVVNAQGVIVYIDHVLNNLISFYERLQKQAAAVGRGIS